MWVGGPSNGTLTWLTSDGANSTQVAIKPTTGVTTQTRWLPFGAAAAPRDCPLDQPAVVHPAVRDMGARGADLGRGRDRYDQSSRTRRDQRVLSCCAFADTSPGGAHVFALPGV